MRTSRLLLIGTLLTGVACSSSTSPGGGGAGNPGANEVWAQNTAFNPSSKSITSGTTITFSNKDGVTHTVTSSSVPGGASSFNGNLGAGGTFQTTFSTPGTYQYFCTIHGGPGTGMHGTIVVN